MKTMFPVYGETLANLSCSIMRYFGADAPSPSLKKLDDLLAEKQPKNIVLALFDGLGANILRRTLPESSFLRRHMQEDIYSVFPPTTVAATAAVENGMYPASSGWLGWNSYFPEVDDVVTTYSGNLKESGKPASDKNLAFSLMRYETIRDKINRLPDASAAFAHPFGSRPYNSFEELCERVKAACEGSGKNFLYAYHTQPDEAEHIYGTDSPEAVEWIERLDGVAEMMYEAMPEGSMLIVVADHGHINSETVFLEDYPELFGMLRITTSCEGRACAIFLKDECSYEDFSAKFNAALGDKFTLYSKEEVKANRFFGDAEPHERFEGMIGDCLAVAGDRWCLEYRRHEGDHPAVSNHAGITEDEMLVPFVVACK